MPERRRVRPRALITAIAIRAGLYQLLPQRMRQPGEAAPLRHSRDMYRWDINQTGWAFKDRVVAGETITSPRRPAAGHPWPGPGIWIHTDGTPVDPAEIAEALARTLGEIIDAQKRLPGAREHEDEAGG